MVEPVKMHGRVRDATWRLLFGSERNYEAYYELCRMKLDGRVCLENTKVPVLEWNTEYVIKNVMTRLTVIGTDDKYS